MRPKHIRCAIATIFLVGITALLAGIGGPHGESLAWMAKLQFLPSCLALNAAVIIALCALTLIAGRIYCSVICPLGIFQDGVLWLRRRIAPKRKQPFKKEHKALRYGIWVLFIASLIAGLQVIVALIDPYSIYGRMVGSIVRGQGWVTPVIAAVFAITVICLAWTGGRTWCNDICPVGTTLSLLSRFSIFRPVIDPGRCTHCGACERTCRASCIDAAEGRIDASRCVVCLDCLESCKAGALSYRPAWSRKNAGANDSPTKASSPGQEAPDTSRRAFITASAITAGSVTLKAQGEKLDGGLAMLEAKKKPARKERPVPFGARSVKDFYSHCTACQLCVSVCPEKVLKPSTDLQHLMQPEMTFEDGYCRIGCTACSQVCPSGAILPLTPEEKSMQHIGVAVVDLDLCVVNTDGVSCGSCSRHCPASAIRMVPVAPGSKLRIPAVDEEKCIGCGACEHLCPSRPFSAIHVDGISVHRKS